MTQKGSDLQKIKELLKIMKANDLVELEIKHGDDKIVLKRSGPAPAPAVTSVPLVAASVPAAAPATDANGAAVPADPAAGVPAGDNLVEITSPIVGTLYSAPSPDSDPFVDLETLALMPYWLLREFYFARYTWNINDAKQKEDFANKYKSELEKYGRKEWPEFQF